MSGIRSNEKGIVGSINRLAVKINGLSDSVSAFPGKKPEILAMIVYAVAHFVMAIFHEPWYDEAVAWQIARCASVRDILFEIPHYEGHPPLWHLILLPFAKLGAPYELSLSFVSLLFTGFAVCLILWNSPFPRIVRLLLPFTYFFFYQYGVISRPYCVMMLAFILLAMNYHSRNEKPGRYTLCLMLLCLTSAYGIVIAGGLAIVWVWEIWNRRNIISFVKSFLFDKRIWWLASLLVLALALIAEIMPHENTVAIDQMESNSARNGFLLRLFYMLFVCLPDVLFTNVYWDYDFLRLTDLDNISVICCGFLGALILFVVFCVGKRRNSLGEFFVPYALFTLFSGIVYFCLHHSGILLLLFIFWLWISLDDSSINDNDCDVDTCVLTDFKGLIIICCSLSLFVSLFWTTTAIALDISKDYATGRNVAAFIAENNLDDYQIMVSWLTHYDEEDGVLTMNTERCTAADVVAPYFESNIFYNYMGGDDSKNYTSHRVPTDEECIQTLEEWKRQGYPDVLFMEPNLSLIWAEEDISYTDYTMVYCNTVHGIWKYISGYRYVTLYLRNDLLDETGLTPAEFPSYQGLY